MESGPSGLGYYAERASSLINAPLFVEQQLRLCNVKLGLRRSKNGNRTDRTAYKVMEIHPAAPEKHTKHQFLDESKRTIAAKRLKRRKKALID